MARQAAVDAALLRLDGLAEEFPDHLALVVQLRDRYEHEASHAAERRRRDRPTRTDQELLDHQAIRLSIVAAQREAVIRLRDDGDDRRRGAASRRAGPRPRGGPHRGLTRPPVLPSARPNHAQEAVPPR